MKIREENSRNQEDFVYLSPQPDRLGFIVGFLTLLNVFAQVLLPLWQCHFLSQLGMSVVSFGISEAPKCYYLACHWW